MHGIKGTKTKPIPRKKVSNPYKTRITSTQLQWWINKGHSIDEATKLWKESQSARSVGKLPRQEILDVNVGDVFSKWTIIDLNLKRGRDVGKTKNMSNVLYVHVRCKCGAEEYRPLRSVRKGITTGCRKCVIRRGINSTRYGGYKDLSGTIMHHFRHGAKNRSIAFEVDAKGMHELFEAQNRCCAISGVTLDWDTASLDRIDSSLGYVLGNVQWVHKQVNLMKHKLSDAELREWCTIIYTYNKDQ